MTLRLKTDAWLRARHCCVALTDWDMEQELGLETTTDQLLHDDLKDRSVCLRAPGRACRRKDGFIWYDRTSDSFVSPSPWLWVSPSISCPIQYSRACEDHIDLNKPSNEHQGPGKSRSTGRTDRGCDLLGCWPRPPVNYCILIGLALRSSSTGSLKVQQIYSFTREHFPFFQTAPDGWKNTIRHNLCFNSSFRKTCTALGRDSKRKSCLWHLTTDGERRLKDDMAVLSVDTLKLLQRSMSQPGILCAITSH